MLHRNEKNLKEIKIFPADEKTQSRKPADWGNLEMSLTNLFVANRSKLRGLERALRDFFYLMILDLNFTIL